VFSFLKNRNLSEEETLAGQKLRNPERCRQEVVISSNSLFKERERWELILGAPVIMARGTQYQKWSHPFGGLKSIPGTLRNMLGIWHFAEKLQK
jgi:hypothetical protein